ncbi:MAG: hypothetical protein K2O06_11565 [Acetatifactor sp.]|nr:hypothetical protein [Acetatifactor sp.]
MKIIAVTQKGINKAENEDRLVVGKSILAGGTLFCEIESGILAAADGVGGNNAGSAAAHFVAGRVCMLQNATKEAMQKINADLLDLSAKNVQYNGMASTLSGILLFGGKGCLFSVGNTRVYSLQRGKYLKQLTTDDTTLNYLLETGQLTADEAQDFDRKNEITACFGGGRADLFKIELSHLESIAFPILITSDGIHDYLSVDQMEDIIGEHGLTEMTCNEMISGARAAGSQDDASIILGFPT